ncbi:glycosyltransferase [Halanaerobacter jeridensis]|uniref:Glycosyltransferase involved in cell wall biosynthesis n=1 Tax=Halanaerobacter jeridensis TaxID=706427 RepID=A0A939BPJ6_9FIRM|nr:glycosyltransferase [Halanaerobacter jeridensis]MBM7556943.1 glycosyltransferase involved in cell wall biosynthesis [Halanaerobacter jeridensis]
MKISGFSMVRNATKLYYPIKEAIESVLPICDEFVVAVGKGDEDDYTRERIESIDSDKIKIIDTEWDIESQRNGVIHAEQTNLALEHCTGDWCFYIQADEIVHEKYLPIIKDRCIELADDDEVEALVFDYRHFWGDYRHYQISHGWYKREVRVIKNNCNIRSNNSAQGFRKKNGEKPKAAHANAEIFHYGWVRPPRYMEKKRKAFHTIHWGKDKAEEFHDGEPEEFDYGPLNRLPVYNGTHPDVMKEWINNMDWEDKLKYSGKTDPSQAKHEDQKLKNKILTYIEQKIEKKFGGKVYLSAHRNYELLGTK